MSMRYAGETVLILNDTVSPTLLLNSVANPWISGSPDPFTSHSVDGLPGSQFSATILFAGAAHGSTPRGAAISGSPASEARAHTAPAMTPILRSGPRDMAVLRTPALPRAAAGARDKRSRGSATAGRMWRCSPG